MQAIKTSTRGGKAEGLCDGFPYTTELVSSEGVSIHFWVEGEYDKAKLALALHRARNNCDIVCASWSEGVPDGFWAMENMR